MREREKERERERGEEKKKEIIEFSSFSSIDSRPGSRVSGNLAN
jgi:hypothetical protein